MLEFCLLGTIIANVLNNLGVIWYKGSSLIYCVILARSEGGFVSGLIPLWYAMMWVYSFLLYYPRIFTALCWV